MKKLTLGMIIVSLAILSGCTHVRLVQKEGCTRNLLFIIPWDNCENVDQAVPVPNQDIRGDASINRSQ